MGIEADAEKDLALSDEDAEGVVGGHKVAKKTAAHHAAATHTAAAATGPKIIYEPEPAGTPAPNPSQQPSDASSPSSPSSDC